MLLKILSHRRARIALICLMGIGIAGMGVAWKMGVNLAVLKEVWGQVNTYLVNHPAALFWALVFLPALPIPTSALLFTAGMVWRQRPLMACLLCLLAMLLNVSWTYWLAAGPGRKLVEKMLASTSFQFPDLPRGDHLRLILIMRLTPGFPFFVQNFGLGFMRAPFLLYLPVSMLCSGVIGSGVVLSGAGLADGKLIPALTGISLIAVGVIFAQVIRRWLAKRKKAVGSGAGE